jgi:hypothetical protein
VLNIPLPARLPCLLQTSRRFAEEKRKAEELALKRRQEEQARGDAERLRQLQDQWRSNATMAKASTWLGCLLLDGLLGWVCGLFCQPVRAACLLVPAR